MARVESFCWPDLLLICVHTCVMYAEMQKYIYLVHTHVFIRLFVGWLVCLLCCTVSQVISEKKRELWIVHKNQACNLRCIYMRLHACVCLCVSRFGNLYTIKSDYMSTSYGQRIPRDFDNAKQSKGKCMASDHNNNNNRNNRNNNNAKPLPL